MISGYPFAVGEPCKATEAGVIHSKDCITIEVRYTPTNKSFSSLGPPEWQTVYRMAACVARLREFVARG